MTPDALLDLPKPAQGKHYERNHGELIVAEVAGALHELLKTKILEILEEHRLRTRSGRRASSAPPVKL